MPDLYQYETTYAIEDCGKDEHDAYYPDEHAAYYGEAKTLHINTLNVLASVARAGIIGGLPMSDRIIDAVIALEVEAHRLASVARAGIIGGLPMSDRIIDAVIALEAAANQLAALPRAVQEAE